MCLIGTKESFDKAEALRKKPGFRYYWKIVQLIIYNYGVHVISPIQTAYRWHPGWNTSHRFVGLNYVERATRCINRGIHIHRNRAAARDWLCNFSFRIIRVKCYNKDCVAISSDGQDAVYTKVFLFKDEYEDAKRRNVIERRGKKKQTRKEK